YDGDVKMGDTPSLLYLMNGNPDDPLGESWGGSFERCAHSTRYVFNGSTSLEDTVAVYSLVEFNFKGPVVDIPKDSACFTMAVGKESNVQNWPGYYLGDGKYGIRYAAKQAETLEYIITSDVPGFEEASGQLVV